MANLAWAIVHGSPSWDNVRSSLWTVLIPHWVLFSIFVFLSLDGVRHVMLNRAWCKVRYRLVSSEVDLGPFCNLFIWLCEVLVQLAIADL